MESLAGWLNGLSQVVADQSGVLEDLSGQMAFLDREVVSVQENLNALARYHASREQAFAELGSEWVSAAFSIANFIAENYAHSFFFPGLLEQYWREANLANANLTQGAYEAGLSMGQQVCLHVWSFAWSSRSSNRNGASGTWPRWREPGICRKPYSSTRSSPRWTWTGRSCRLR